MKKIYKGWELMKAIADGEIKKGTKFKDKYKREVGWNGNNLVFMDSDENYMSTISDIYFINEEFEVIEDEIDIDSIEKLDDTCYIMYGMQDEEIENYHNKTRTTINEILQALKQIDKRVKKLEKYKNGN